MGQNWVRNQVFCHFLTDQDDSLKQCLTTSRCNTKNNGGKGVILGKRAKIGPKITFLAIFSSLVHDIFFKLHMMIAQNNVQLLREVKLTEEILADTNLGQEGQNWDQNQVFYHFLKFGSLVFPQIAHDVTLEQCLATSRGKTLKKILGPKFWPSGSKSGLKLGFFPFSQVWLISVPLNCMQ